jgi:hypothetical protein
LNHRQVLQPPDLHTASSDAVDGCLFIETPRGALATGPAADGTEIATFRGGK